MKSDISVELLNWLNVDPFSYLLIIQYLLFSPILFSAAYLLAD